VAKLSVTRLLETAKLLQTEAGQQLSELIDYTNNTFEQLIRALRNGLSFSDNFNCKVSTVELTHDVFQIVNTDGKTPSQILCGRTFSLTTAVEALVWYVDDANQVQVKAFFVGAPTAKQRAVLTIFF
jgi:hypothetical protein